MLQSTTLTVSRCSLLPPKLGCGGDRSKVDHTVGADRDVVWELLRFPRSETMSINVEN